MRFFNDLSIQKKLVSIQILTACVVLALAVTAFVVEDTSTSREEMVQRLSSTALIVGQNCISSLQFLDEEAATQTLNSLAIPHIIHACIYDENGAVFATYSRQGESGFTFPSPAPSSHAFGENSLEIFIDLSFERDLYYQLVVNSLGTLYDMETDGVRHVAWDSQSRLATARQDSAWTVEMAIPLARLSLEPLIDSGDHLGVNVCRSRVLRGLQASVERGCWSATGSSYHNRGRYGMLVLD